MIPEKASITMSGSTKILEPAFQGAGQRIGTEIWRIENFQPVPLPKTNYGKFYSGDSYIILQTTSGKGGSYQYDIHFWIGKDTSQDEAGAAAIKTVEFDAALGGRAVQHRELQGHESDKFLSYFKPCIIPLEGGVASGFKTPEKEKFENRLYVCKGKRVVRMKQVLFSRSSLNHDDVFILDTENKIYQFNGANSNIQERAKSLEVIQYLKDKYHEGKCEVAIIDDGKLVAESDSGEFWVLFGGFAPIGKKPAGEDDAVLEITPPKIYSINDGQLKLEEGTLSKAMLENNKCYLLDSGAEIHVWVGRVTQLEERKAAYKAAEELINSENRSKATRIIQIIQGYETHSFKSNFDSWPMGGTGISGGEEGRGKVAALLKQQGVDVKGSAKNAPVSEEVPPLLEAGGKVEVWRINGSAKTRVPKEEIGKFYGGDCYIVLFTYHSGDKKEEYFLACWIGKESIQDDQMMAARLANTMWTSMKGRPVQGRIFQGKEPPQFIALFQPMVVLKGGLSTGYKKSIAEKNMNDETYGSDNIALICVSGTSVHNNKAVQVDAVTASLNSHDCFLLQSGNSLFIWQGNSSTFEQHQWATKIAEFLKPGVSLKHVKEGTESSAFWYALGGKQSFSSKRAVPDIVRDPHLYTFSFKQGKIEVTEVFNFSQDDLLTEDMLILCTYAEVFVWIGYSVESKEKQKAFDIGQKYIDLAVCLDGLSPDVPLYKVTEGNEPCFFTAYFSWDSTKAVAHGNSFDKKLALLFGTGFQALESNEKPNSTNQSGPTQRASALAALSSAFNPSSKSAATGPKPIRSSKGGSQRAAAVAALSSVLTAEQKKAQSEGSTHRHSRTSSPDSTAFESFKIETATSETEDPVEVAAVKVENEVDGFESESNGTVAEVNQDSFAEDKNGEKTFSYERLKAKSSNPVTGIDYKRREAYLSDVEFQTVLGMTKDAFYLQPKWKQDMQKRKVDLF
ncbi:villin-2-like isoform X2 [Phalaenopsis equestris]|uniref:villin-2-like isoform X2 n=1 Tax=Phalaenopsis equestris TaxID=78828 RepID=UPI0009E58922|nr:villin-2-like isoform X2 [Phalaenopsis equestris]